MAALGKRSLTLTIDGTERAAEVSSAEITSQAADSGFISFANAATGGAREYRLKLTFVQDPSVNSLWDELWSNAGTTIPCVLHPAGGVAADATHPAFTMSVVISEPDGTMLGGEASESASERWTTEVEWVCTGKPVRTPVA
jgi:hypothetical protein